MRKIAIHMGMPISIDIPGTKSAAVFNDLFALCEDTDTRFSPYKTTSELSKLWRGLIKERDTSQDMQHVMAECERYEKLTDGYFSARFAGTFNPTGYVKAWAIKRMVDNLANRNIHTYLINAGGDIVARSAGKHSWNIAIANPKNTAEPIANLTVDNLAIATSGSYEKGSHIYNPHTKTPTDTLASVTIFGADIILADVLATAVYAMGEQGTTLVHKHPGYQAIFVAKDGTVTTTAKT